MPAQENFEFALPYVLWLIIPALALLFLRRKEGNAGTIAFSSLFLLEKLGKRPGGRVGLLGLILFILSLILGILALARPIIVNEREFTTASGIDMVIAFDLSTSMHAEDMQIFNQRVSRLNAAKYVISDFIDKRPDDRLGLVAFAGKPKIFSPLTLDHDLLQSHINRFNPSLMQEDGTAIGSAIAAAASRLEDRKETKSKIIILVTDGVNNAGELTPIEAATLAAKLGIKIYTVAIGSDQKNSGYLQADFDESTLRQIAQITGGEHFRARNSQMFINAFNSIDKLEKSEAKRHTIRKENELFPWFIAGSLLFLLIGSVTEIVRPRPAP